MGSGEVDLLREILAKPRALPGLPSRDDRLFGTRAVAGVFGGSPKVVRWLAHTKHLKAVKRPGKKARKLFFEAGEIRRFQKACRPGTDSSRAFHSEKIAAHPEFISGNAVTKDQAAIELQVSKRGVEYYLEKGELERVPSSRRTTLISKKSLARLAWKRIEKAHREYEQLRERLDRAGKKKKKLLVRFDASTGHVIV